MNNEETMVKKEPYFGSVLFFKHLFSTVFVLLITVPTVISILLAIRISGLKETERELRQQLETQPTEVSVNTFHDIAESTDPASPEVELPAYTSMYPDFYAPEIKYSSVHIDKSCYLTFDDGPTECTKEILQILEEKNVPGNFFVTKQNTEEGREILRQVAEAGHTIGMHTASHEYISLYASVEDFLADYYELYCWIKEVTGEAPTIFRFPGGSINSYNRIYYKEIISEMTRRGFIFYDWNISAGDAYTKTTPAEQIKYNCLNDTADLNRVFILMHDGEENTTTVSALPDIIDGYLENGFTIEKLTPEVTPVAFTYPY